MRSEILGALLLLESLAERRTAEWIARRRGWRVREVNTALGGPAGVRNREQSHPTPSSADPVVAVVSRLRSLHRLPRPQVTLRRLVVAWSQAARQGTAHEALNLSTETDLSAINWTRDGVYSILDLHFTSPQDLEHVIRRFSLRSAPSPRLSQNSLRHRAGAIDVHALLMEPQTQIDSKTDSTLEDMDRPDIELADLPDDLSAIAGFRLSNTAQANDPLPFALSPLRHETPVADIRIANPSLFSYEDNGNVLTPTSLPCHEPPEDIVPVIADHNAKTLHLDSHGQTTAAGWERTGRARYALDHPAFHRHVDARRCALAHLLSIGCPVIPLALESVDALRFPDPLPAMMRTALHLDLSDPVERERYSVMLRRSALQHFGPDPAWRNIRQGLGLAIRPPYSVSAIVLTCRPDRIPTILHTLDKQTYPNLEIVIALHGIVGPEIDWPDTTHYVTVVNIPASYVFGDALNAAWDAAGGDILTKIDDDDDYGPDHIFDLVQALTYSGAELVGKGAEFIHFEELGFTIRRQCGWGERWDKRLAGPTITMTRDTFHSLNGWRPAQQGLDTKILADAERLGASHYRTHGFGFLLRRRSKGHTWNAEIDHFLRPDQRQWRGVPQEVIGL